MRGVFQGERSAIAISSSASAAISRKNNNQNQTVLKTRGCMIFGSILSFGYYDMIYHRNSFSRFKSSARGTALVVHDKREAGVGPVFFRKRLFSRCWSCDSTGHPFDS